jgi:xylose isomerase
MIEILCAGGFASGDFNFDAKVRRQSVDALDLRQERLENLIDHF